MPQEDIENEEVQIPSRRGKIRDPVLTVRRNQITLTWYEGEGGPQFQASAHVEDNDLRTYPDGQGDRKNLRTFLRLANLVKRALREGTIAMLLLLVLTSCAVPVRAYPPKTANGEATPLPVVMAKSNGAPVEPGFLGLGDVPWLELVGMLLGVKLGGDAVKGGIRVLAAKRACKRKAVA